VRASCWNTAALPFEGRVPAASTKMSAPVAHGQLATGTASRSIAPASSSGGKLRAVAATVKTGPLGPVPGMSIPRGTGIPVTH